MPLVTLQNHLSQWTEIKEAAQILHSASSNADIQALRNDLFARLPHTFIDAMEFYTGVNVSRRAVIVTEMHKVTLAFEGSDPKELIKNTWTNAKGPNWWDIPYPVFNEGNRVHSFYRDMWHGMRQAIFVELENAIQSILLEGFVPSAIIVTGFSMGGGVSTMAFTDILEHVRCIYGSESKSQHYWALDSNLGLLLQHLTFAAIGAGDRGFHTVLNRLYEQYSIRAWDFMHHNDMTRHAHDFAFRSWRGHRYILSDAVVRDFANEFGPQSHFILGYLKATEWMEENGGDEVKPEFSY